MLPIMCYTGRKHLKETTFKGKKVSFSLLAFLCNLFVWGKGKLISLILFGSCVNVRSFMFPTTGQTPVFHYGVIIKTPAVTLSVLGQRCPVFGI